MPRPKGSKNKNKRIVHVEKDGEHQAGYSRPYCVMHGRKIGDATIPGPCNGLSDNCPQNRAKKDALSQS